MMAEYVIDSKESAKDFQDYVNENPDVKPRVLRSKILFNGDIFEPEGDFEYLLEEYKSERKSKKVNPDDNSDVSSSDSGSTEALIFGKDATEGIVSAEVKDNELYLFKNDGSVEKRPNEYWILGNRSLGRDCDMLDGDLPFKFIKTFEDYQDYQKARGIMYARKTPMYSVYDPVEAAMIREGFTFFKGLKVEDVSVLSFDIESTGIAHNSKSQVLLISNTFRKNGKVSRKLFSIDEYKSDSEMIVSWCNWVREIDPSIMIGHNIFGFDLPYLNHCCDEPLYLGKDNTEVNFSTKAKKFRKDGSQSYDYFDARIFGRQVIDTFFLSIKFDVGRNYPSYGLKPIIEYEGLEKKGRIKWDWEKVNPGKLWEKQTNPTKDDRQLWEDFKTYCKDDADDSLKLYDLMIPSFFYYCQSLPMPFQTMNQTATGRQINGFLCRSYLQSGHSIPMPSAKEEYGGGISFGNPGLYTHVYKVDVASLYPSIIITDEIYDKQKDPNQNFLRMVKYFTEERLINKKKGKDTGDRHFKDLEQAQKIVINSAYGLLGASGLNFNSPENADQVTAKGREILETGIKWAEGNGFKIVNVDTDSFSYSTGKKLALIDQKKADQNGVQAVDEFAEQIEELNSNFDDGIIWEDDGHFDKFLVVKAKNYVMVEGKKIKIKGSGLLGTNKEPALQEFMTEIIGLLLAKKRDHIYSLYEEYGKRIKADWNPEEWSMKKTVTNSVLNPERTQEQKVLDAIQDIDYQEGDKVHLFSQDKDTLKLTKDFNGEYCRDTYYNKLFKTLEIFENLIDPTLFPNYKTGRNKNLI